MEGGHLKIINLAVPAQGVLTHEPVPAGMEDAVRLALAVTLLTSSVFSDGADEASVARLRELGPESPEPRTRAVVTVLLTLQDMDQERQSDPQALLRLAESEDVHVAQWASMWASQTRENLGDLPAAIASAERSLALVDDEEGPWARALVTAHLAALVLQDGDRDAARDYAAQAFPTMAALGAVEDWAQCRALIALVDIAQGNLAEAELILDDLAADERVQSVFGGAISQQCGRAELLLAQGRVEEGLADYRQAVHRLSSRGAIPGLTLPGGFEPWVLFPQAGAVAACCRHGRREEAHEERDALLAKARTLLTGDSSSLDYPIMGSVLFALAVWELTGGRQEVGAGLLAIAHGFSFNRMLPSFDAEWAATLAPDLAPYDGDRGQLREEAVRLLAQLD